jgi:hypothetical protein
MGRQKFRKQTVKVSLPHPLYNKTEVLCEMTAWLIEQNGIQLAVHHSVKPSINTSDEVVAMRCILPKDEKHKSWTVTHINTGKSLGLYAPSEVKARQIAQAVLYDKTLSGVLNGPDESTILRRARLAGLDNVRTRMDVIRKTVLDGRAHELPGMASGGEE